MQTKQGPRHWIDAARFGLLRLRRDKLMQRLLWDEVCPENSEIVRLTHRIRALDQELRMLRPSVTVIKTEEE